MFCKNCGKEINDNAVICPNCGCSVSDKPIGANNVNDTGSTGWGVLGFFFPLIGLILYLVWKEDKPITARVAGKGALIGVIVSVAFSILTTILTIGCASCIAAGM